MQNYFQTFEIPVAFNVDLEELEQKYFLLQMKFHPDRSVGKSESEKMAIISKSADVNDAMQILKHNVLRAEYMLLLQGVIVNGEKDNTYSPSQELLMEQIELREQAEEVGSDFIVKIEKLIGETEEDFVKSYENKAYKEAAHATMRLKFLDKLIMEIENIR